MIDIIIYGSVVFASLFTLVNPLGAIPVFINLTGNLNYKNTKKIALKIIVVSIFVLTLFMIFGQVIFKFFGISTNSFRIVGGILFFLMGYDMLQAKMSRTKTSRKDGQFEKIKDNAITPVAIPMLAGPGAITHLIIKIQDTPSFYYKISVFIAMFLVFSLTYFLFIAGKRIMKLLGKNGNKIMLRIMGLIVMVIAVEFFFSGLTPILKNIIN
ncbi:MAG TPA: MarC family protein [Candidatus Mcinerneyibacterium sp.]|nr:MarC family protein [Candidatus Mcinerneyibacterium sp.]